MRLESAKLLEDIRVAASDALDMAAGHSFDDYLTNKQLRYAVERCFEIVQARDMEGDAAHAGEEAAAGRHARRERAVSGGRLRSVLDARGYGQLVAR